MLSKIKRWAHLPLSLKLSLSYAGILLIILCVTSCLTIGSLYYSLYRQPGSELRAATEKVAQDVAAGMPIHKALEEQERSLKTERKFFSRLINNLVWTSLLGILAALAAGLFLSKRFLLPIRTITAAAKKIEVTDLSKRIAIPATKDELQELAETYNSMLSRIEEGFASQKQFVSDASHELRTPITVISGYTNMLERWGKDDPKILQEGLLSIKQEANNMENLIEKLLFLARADQNKKALNKEIIELAPLLAEVVKETQLIAPNHKVLLKNNVEAKVFADGPSLKQLFRSLLSNSIKYTEKGGTITLTSQLTNNTIEIRISDTGIGIAKEEQTKIFTRFYRVDAARSKETGGTGLGLAVAKCIADEHNIKIEITSELGKGTTITLILTAGDGPSCQLLSPPPLYKHHK